MEQAELPEKVGIRPSKIPGNWADGYAPDAHKMKSEYIGDEYGYPRFDTTRTPLGELLYRLKYRQDQTAIEPIVHTVVNFLNSWGIPFDAIVPVPPSNTRRSIQPVIEVSKGISEISGILLCETCIRKVKDTGQLKDVTDPQKRKQFLKDAFTVDQEKTFEKKLLLFDDLYRSGETVNEIARVLSNEGKASAVYLLTLTRSGRRS